MKEKNHLKSVLNFILYLLMICSLVFCVIHYIGQRTVVEGSSMEPALRDGDNLIVDKISYHFHDPKRFDVVVFPDRETDGEYYIKRIIALPGENVRIDAGDGGIYIDGEKLEESYGREVIKEAGLAAAELALGPEEYFVLGDNRNDSMDSRDSRIGMVKREALLGRAWIRVYPFGAAGRI